MTVHPKLFHKEKYNKEKIVISRYTYIGVVTPDGVVESGRKKILLVGIEVKEYGFPGQYGSSARKA